MIIHNIEQRSPAWYELRWGRITGSIVKYLFAGAVSQETMYRSLSEQRANPNGWEEDMGAGFDNDAMRWGRDHEDQAISNLELDRHVEILRGPVVETLDVPLLVSLDGMTEDHQPVEIKCPYNPSNHKNYCANGMGIHKYQLTAGMIVTGQSSGIFMSYDPRDGLTPCYYQTMERDQELAADIMERCIAMDKMVNEGSFVPFVSEKSLPVDSFPALF